MSGDLPGFAARALQEAVKDPSWLPLCDLLHDGIRRQIADMNVGKRFCELSSNEQVALVEKNWKDMQQPQGNLALLDAFAARMSREVDEELLKHVLAKYNPQKALDAKTVGAATPAPVPAAAPAPVPASTSAPAAGAVSSQPPSSSSSASSQANLTHATNVDSLVQEFSAAAIEMLESGPANLLNTTKLFINRPLPSTIRPYIWSRALWAGNKPYQKPLGRLAPSLDLMLSRRCHALLDNKFPRLSSRANAAYCKTVASNFMRMIEIDMPSRSDDSFESMDACIYLCIPLIVLFRSDFGAKKSAGTGTAQSTAGGMQYDEDGNERSEVEFSEDLQTKEAMYKGMNASKNLIENSLYAIMEPRHVGCLRVSGGKISFVPRAPGIGRAVTLLSTKDSELYMKLWTLKPPPPAEATRRPDDDFSSTKTTFEAFFNEQLLRGLSGLLNLETCMYVWDQGFIKDFGGILPLVLIALALGDAAELKGLSIFSSAIETFTSYCRSVTVEQLQGLLGAHFPAELADLFDISGNYRFRRGNDGIMQAVYKRIGAGTDEGEREAAGEGEGGGAGASAAGGAAGEGGMGDKAAAAERMGIKTPGR